MPLKLSTFENIELETITPQEAKKRTGSFEKVLRVSVPQPDEKPTIVLDVGLTITDIEDLLHMLRS